MESSTARIGRRTNSLAQADVNYGWSIGGNGYGSTVTSGRWREFDERLNVAPSALVEAARLKMKCPQLV